MHLWMCIILFYHSTDIDECDNDHNGGCRQICRNLPGTYRCECEDNNLCHPGFILDELTDQCHGE